MTSLTYLFATYAVQVEGEWRGGGAALAVQLAAGLGRHIRSDGKPICACCIGALQAHMVRHACRVCLKPYSCCLQRVCETLLMLISMCAGPREPLQLGPAGGRGAGEV